MFRSTRSSSFSWFVRGALVLGVAAFVLAVAFGVGELDAPSGGTVESVVVSVEAVLDDVGGALVRWL